MASKSLQIPLGKQPRKTKGRPCGHPLLLMVFSIALAQPLVYQLLDLALDIAVGTPAGFAGPQQEPSPSPDRPITVSPQPSTQVAPITSGATIVAQVEISRGGQQTIVRVEGNGHLTCQPERLNNPERLVLDFSGARLAVRRTSMLSPFPPVRGVRLGQFTPNVARVVIDLQYPAAYGVKSQGNSLTVAFAVSNAAPVSTGADPQAPTKQEKDAARASRMETRGTLPRDSGRGRTNLPLNAHARDIHDI